jgi:GAG-pre-integrase domain
VLAPFDTQYGPSAPPQAFTTQSLPSSPVGDWYLDSGATHHVTSDLNNLSNFTAYDGQDTLQIGNSAGMIISHIGSSIIHIANHQIELHNILHVPSFTKKLLSLSQLLLDNSLIIEFSSNTCFIKDRLTSTPLLQAKFHNGIYSIRLPLSFPPQAFLGARVSADVWHARLGHPSTSTTLKVLNSHNLPCSSKKLSLCQNCCMAKSHKLPFNSNDILSCAPLELVHSDLWGPSPVMPHNGFRYYIIFIDDFTRFSWIYFLKIKDEVINVFTLFKAQVENLPNTTIKVLRTDGGTEYKPLAKHFPQIVHQIACPYTPQQNGVSERKHRHIVELSLAILQHASLHQLF